jgi:hypothetical protein
MWSDTASTWSFFFVLGVIAANRMVVSSRLLGYTPVYWSLQVLDVLGAAAVAVFGIPGFPPALKVLNYFVAFVFVFHLVENHTRRAALRRPAPISWDDERRSLRERLAAQALDANAKPPQAPSEAGPPDEKNTEST